MRIDYDPDHYRTPRQMPHSGNAIEGPDSGDAIGTFWPAVIVIAALLGSLMIYEAFR